MTRGAAIVSAALIAVAVSALLPTLWSQAIQRRAEESAKALAGDSPYCIQVSQGPHGYGYRPITDANELSGFRMRAPEDGGLSFEFHAVLVVEGGLRPSFHNWSYRAGAFVPVTTSALASLYVRIQCDPQAHFVDRLAT